MCGKGELTFNNGKKYIGNFKSNMMHGKGMIVDINDSNTIYQKGQWDKNKYQAQAKSNSNNQNEDSFEEEE